MPNEELGSAQIKVGLNTVEFNKGMAELSKRMQLAGAEFKLASAGLDKVADASKISALRAEELTKKIEIEKQQIALLQAQMETAIAEYGENSKAVLNYELRIKKAETALKNMEAELRTVSDGWRNAAKWCEEHSKQLDKAGKTISGVGSVLTKGLTAPILAGVAALGALANEALESAGALQKQADATGLTTERIQELTYAGAKLDVEIETIVDAQAKLVRAMDNAAKGTKDQKEAFAELGISIADSNGNLRDSNQVFEQVIGALSNMENATERDSLSLRIFGRSAMELNPLIKAGSKELADLTAEARKNGAVLSGQSVKALDDFGDELAAMKLQIQAAGSRLAVDMLPMLKELATTFREKGIPAIKEFLEGVGGLLKGFMSLSPETQKFILTAGAIAVALGPVISGVGKAVSGVGSLIGTFGKLSSAISKAGGMVSWLASGPVVAAIAAIGALGIAIMALVGSESEATKAAKELNKELDESAKAYKENADAISTDAAAAELLVDELYSLARSGAASTAEQIRMASVVAQLNDLYPGLNLQINKQTGLLNMERKAVLEVVAARKQELQLKANEDRLLELYKEKAKITADMGNAQKVLNEFTKIWGDRTRAVGMIMKIDGNPIVYDAVKAVDLLTEAQKKNEAELAAAESGYSSLAMTISSANGQIVTSAQETSKAVRMLSEKDLADRKEYFAQYEELTQQHLDQMGALDDQGIEKTKLTAAQIKKNLEQQIKDFQNWRENIKKLSSRVPSDVMKELEALGPSFSPVIAQLNKMTGDELDKWVAVWREKSALAKNTAVEELGGLPGEAAKSGKAFAEGLAKGMADNAAIVSSAAGSLAKVAIDKLTKVAEIASPSKVTRRIGGYITEGLQMGLQDNINSLRRVAGEIAAAAIPAFSMPAYPSLRMPAPAMAGAGGGGQTINRNVYVTVQPANYTVRSDADIRAITRGIADEVSSKLRALGG